MDKLLNNLKAMKYTPYYNNFNIGLLFLIIGGLVILQSCEEKKTEVLTPAPALSSTISYSRQIQPIFNMYCIACHEPSNFQAINLIDTASYKSLFVNHLIDTLSPEKSELYFEIKEGYMPPSVPLPSTDISLILTWIEQGAKNN